MKSFLKLQLVTDSDVVLDLSLPASLDAATLLQRLPAFLAEPVSTPAGSISVKDAEVIKSIGKRYAPLAAHLAAIPSTTPSVTLSYGEIENILGADLPATARSTHAPAWWSNTETHSQGKAWLAVDWKTSNINPSAETVEFRRK
ncbi:DUF7662 domain-containing protein [Deinococcus aerophilus]|uniref:DUF7662 domain-containing protein n=1 Tax=Deinococcus aerophilus TaxID=522488 RepID=A0ABQ2H1A3_9DEIO|nr:hypothetical protein [Deinococcus aerophilus]GGM21915.1 hypothetical protein GCM10010841_32240 [Deinococcus aerophilus]